MLSGKNTLPLSKGHSGDDVYYTHDLFCFFGSWLHHLPFPASACRQASGETIGVDVPDEFLKAWQEAVATNSKSAKGQLFQLWCAAGGQWGKNLGYMYTVFLQPQNYFKVKCFICKRHLLDDSKIQGWRFPTHVPVKIAMKERNATARSLTSHAYTKFKDRALNNLLYRL